MFDIINQKDLPEITGIFSLMVAIGIPIVSVILDPSKVIIAVFIFFAISVAVTIVRNKYNSEVKIKLTNGNIVLKYGDLWKSEGIIIIPVNTTFDTEVNKELVSEYSLHGYFIKNICDNNQMTLKSEIAKTLNKIDTIEKYGRQQYPPGTIVSITRGKREYYLLALSTFDENNHATLTIDSYTLAISRLLEYCNLNSQGETICMPIIGTGSSRFLPDKENALDLQIAIIKSLDSIKNGSDIQIIIKKENEIVLNHHKY